MSVPERLTQDRRTSGPPPHWHRAVRLDASDLARAQRTIPRTLGGPDDGSAAVDCDVWLWHVLFERRRDRQLRALLVEEYTAYAHNLARRAYHRREPLEDLRQVALLALLGALERFECERSIPFPGFATPTIIGALKRHHRDHGWAVRIPRQAHTVATSLPTAESRLDARTGGRPPTSAELAAELGIEVADLVEAQSAIRSRMTLSLDAPATLGDPTTIDVEVTEAGYGRAESRSDLIGALDELSTREREVLGRYYLEGQNQRQIGEAIGISQMQVSRVLRSALARLRARMATADGPGRRRHGESRTRPGPR